MSIVTNKKLLSIIVPVYNEEETVNLLYETVVSVMSGIQDKYDYELIFTDNHSVDSTFQILECLSKSDNHVKVLRFSRNFGYQKSILTGYLHANGDIAIQLDCDLQDPPELIPEFLKHWEMGYQVVYGVRRSRKENWWINSLRKLFYRLIDFLSEDSLPHDAGDFQLIDKKIINELKHIQDLQPYLRGAIASIGFKQIGIPYDRNERTKGTSKFHMADMISLAIDGILNHSVVPLRVATYIGIFISVLTFIALIGFFIGKVFYEKDWPAGFTITIIFILLSLSLNAFFLGIIGEYLGRIYKQVKKRPVTIIERKVNF